MTDPVGDLAFPDLATWLPHIPILNDAADATLDVAHGALHVIGTGDLYDRRTVTHGASAPVEPGDRGGQLYVTVPQVFLGRPGEQQYQLDHGAQGRYGFRTAVFRVRLVKPWPFRESDGQPTQTPKLDAARRTLFDDGMVVWSALVAWALGGVIHPKIQPRVNEIHVGPLTAADPQGGQASWTIDVSILV